MNISHALSSGDCDCQRIDKRGSCRLSKEKLAYFFTAVYSFFITLQNKRLFDNNWNYMTRKHLQKESMFQKKRNLSSFNRLEGYIQWPALKADSMVLYYLPFWLAAFKEACWRSFPPRPVCRHLEWNKRNVLNVLWENHRGNNNWLLIPKEREWWVNKCRILKCIKSVCWSFTSLL